jgi:arsenate reductase
MAEAFANHYGQGTVFAQSAGMEPGTLNRRVVRVMQESGIDISMNGTKSVQQMLDQEFDYVITVCDDTSAECCPVFAGEAKRLHWGFPDPSSFQGPEEQCLQHTREVRDQIESRIREWLAMGPER